MSNVKYIACERCTEWRAALNPQARTCGRCQGTGLVSQSFVCNGCGRTMPTSDGLPEVTIEGGYSSFYLFDMTSYRFGLCERCLRDLFERMVVSPDVYSYGHGSDEPPYTYLDDRTNYADRLIEHAKALGEKVE